MPKKTAASSNTDSNYLLLFDQQDDPRANETLRAALDHAPSVPVLGLVVKVREDAFGEQVVNWMFTDAEHIKFLALLALSWIYDIKLSVKFMPGRATQ